MTRLLGALVLVVLVVGAVGYYLDWFTFTKKNDGKDVHFNVTVNKDKIETDVKKTIEDAKGKMGEGKP